MEEMRVAAAEFLGAIDSEGVIPHDPAAAMKTQVVLECQLQLGRIVIANCQPKCAVRLQDTLDFPAPHPRPLDELLAGTTVFVNVVFIADVERRVREDEIDRFRLQLPKAL